jgi:hypothetical protein
MMGRERPSASEGKIPEAWIGQEVMLETTEALSSDLRAAPGYLEDVVNDRGVVVLVTRHHYQSQFSRYFYPWSVAGWIRLAEADERTEPRDKGSLVAPPIHRSSSKKGILRRSTARSCISRAHLRPDMELD